MNNQNESPFGNPRFIISIIAVFLFLWGWQYYVNLKYPQPIVKITPAKPTAEAPEKGTATTGSAAAGSPQLQAAVASAEEKLFSFEDQNVKWTLSSKGMGLNSLELKSFFDKEKKAIQFSSPNKLFAVVANDEIPFFNVVKTSDTQFVGTGSYGGGSIKRTLTYNKETMSFESETEFEGSPKTLVFSTAENKLVVESSNFLMPSFEKQDFLFKEGEKFNTEAISGISDTDTVNKSIANTGLASISSQYFTQAYIDKSEILPAINMKVIGKTATLDVVYNLKDTKVSKIKSLIFIGPKLTENLNKIDPLLPEVMDYGIFGFISKPLLQLMKFLHGLFGNWGVAIIALTIIMRLLMLPFNVVSFKSARAMQKIQPQLAAVREKYKNDPMAVNRETMALMKQNNANPLSSCLPMLIQIPIFFALWKTIGSSIEIYQQPFFGWITDLSSYDRFFVLPILMGITMYFQQKLTPTTMDPMQAKILNYMPLLFSLFMISLPSGLTLYNFISALFGVGQQYFLLKDNTKKQLS